MRKQRLRFLIGSRSLLGVEDLNVYPIRGQTTIVYAPQVKECVSDMTCARRHDRHLREGSTDSVSQHTIRSLAKRHTSSRDQMVRSSLAERSNTIAGTCP
jgi:hypothetical protein